MLPSSEAALAGVRGPWACAASRKISSSRSSGRPAQRRAISGWAITDAQRRQSCCVGFHYACERAEEGILRSAGHIAPIPLASALKLAAHCSALWRHGLEFPAQLQFQVYIAARSCTQ